jgi:hypothetical protein
LQEYQNKRFTKFAFHKRLILKEIFLVDQTSKAEQPAQKRKAGASSRTPHAVIYKVKYITNKGNVKKKLRE